ncbi:Vasohibin-2 [Fasciola gigantica]|uniref:Vasohibin-2 n=1 Tax=Fasciola gigantica TaxID=46835 RepID=A0A504YVQ7_FASGI|nr:Vasohibin-2 [Fasciola gigantica]
MQFFEVDRKATLEKQYGLAKLMIKAALPIKCLEATILGMYMTQGLKEFRRFTISFTSEFKEQPFKHVVLGVYASGRFGALGLSRRSDLMYKPLEFPTLYSLIQSYSLAYAKNFHQLVRVKIGLVIPHEPHIFETIPWKGLIISKSLLRRLEEMKRVLDQYSRVLRGQIDVLLIMEHSLRLPALSSQSNSTSEIISKQQSTRPKRNWSKGSRRRVTKLKRFAKPSCTVAQSSVFANGVGIPSDIIPKSSTKKSDPFYQIRI